MLLAKSGKSQGFGDREVVKKCPDTTNHPFWWPKNAVFFTSDRFFHKLRVPKQESLYRSFSRALMMAGQNHAFAGVVHRR